MDGILSRCASFIALWNSKYVKEDQNTLKIAYTHNLSFKNKRTLLVVGKTPFSVSVNIFYRLDEKVNNEHIVHSSNDSIVTCREMKSKKKCTY